MSTGIPNKRLNHTAEPNVRWALFFEVLFEVHVYDHKISYIFIHTKTSSDVCPFRITRMHRFADGWSFCPRLRNDHWKIYFPIFNQTNNSNVFKCLTVTKWNTSTQAVHKICVTAGLPCPKNAEDGSQGCIVRTLFVGAAQTLGRARHHFHDESKMYPYPSLE